MHSTETQQPLDQIIGTPFTAEMRDWLNAEAKRQRRKRAEIIRFAVEQYRESLESEKVSAA